MIKKCSSTVCLPVQLCYKELGSFEKAIFTIGLLGTLFLTLSVFYPTVYKVCTRVGCYPYPMPLIKKIVGITITLLVPIAAYYTLKNTPTKEGFEPKQLKGDEVKEEEDPSYPIPEPGSPRPISSAPKPLEPKQWPPPVTSPPSTTKSASGGH